MSTDPRAAAAPLRCQVYLLPEEDGGFSAFAADLPGAVSQGDTEEEALANIKEALEGLLASYRDQGKPVPWEPGDTVKWFGQEGLGLSAALARWVEVDG